MGILNLFREKSVPGKLRELDKEYKERREKKEFEKVEKAGREKKGDWLGHWLEKFSIEGDFWSKEKEPKEKKEDWL